jgi:alpha-tubulin suppressor-like RCC1 family protein
MGANGAGELGDGTYTVHYSPEQIESGVIIKALAAGEGHSLIVKSDGSLWGMGDNTYGQLGLGSVPGTNYQTEIVSSGVTAVAAGPNHSLFVKSDGSLWAMGYNNFGQLGDNSTTDKHTPEQVGVNVVAVAAGKNGYSLFIKSDGSLWGMGANIDGSLGAGTNFTYKLPIQIVASNVVAVAAGNGQTLFIKSDGSLWGMGFNAEGQLSGNAFSYHTPIQIVAGPPPRPLITGISLSGANLNLTAANGVSGELVYTLMGTNLTQPLSQWQPVATNLLSANGNFTITATNAVSPGARQQFYILQAQ